MSKNMCLVCFQVTPSSSKRSLPHMELEGEEEDLSDSDLSSVSQPGRTSKARKGNMAAGVLKPGVSLN